MEVLLIILIGSLLIYNLVLNISNLTRIVNYCFDTGSLSQYWELFYKGCFHAKAIYSSIFIFIIGFFVFVAIAPFVLISGFVNRKELKEKINQGLYIEYTQLNLLNQTFKYNNIGELGINKFEPTTATGKIQIDCVMVMMEIDEKCKEIGLKIEQNVIQHYDLDNRKKVTIPLVVNVDEKVFPVYFIYTEFHKLSYQKINPILKANHFENAIYFSIISM